MNSAALRPQPPIRAISRAQQAELNNALFTACWRGASIETIDDLIARGAKVNARNNSRETPLIAAADSRSSDIVMALLKHGANKNARDDNGSTALMVAVSKTKSGLDVIRALLAHGADLNVGNHNGERALHLAAAYERHEAALLLIQAGADKEAQTITGQTPLHVACETNAADMPTARVLIEHGAEPNAVDGRGKTPLRLALDVHVPMKKQAVMLIAHGASSTAGIDRMGHFDVYGMPAIHAATRAGLTNRLVELLAAGADTGTLFHGLTPVQAAEEAGQWDSLAVLQSWMAREAIDAVEAAMALAKQERSPSP